MAVKEQEEKLAKMNPWPKTKEEIEIEKMAEKYKRGLNDLDMLPYNRDRWRKGGVGWRKERMDRGNGWDKRRRFCRV